MSTSTSFVDKDGAGFLDLSDNGAVVVSDEEVSAARRRNSEEESIELARQLMAEEAMASYQHHVQMLRIDQLSQEDFAAFRTALETDDGMLDEQRDDEEDPMSSYDAMLQLGERIGDVKSERWSMIAKTEIEKLPKIQFKKDCRVELPHCLVCQCEFEHSEELRELPCQHCFHVDCVDQWLMEKDFCPHCRHSIVGEVRE